MSKRLIIFIAVFCFAASSVFAQLPYSKMLDLNTNELKEKKFKYDKNKNSYSMSKSNKTNNTMNILSAVGGAAADIKPHQEDYTITVQKGANDVNSFVSVLFHNDNTYHTILTWIAENNITPIETSSGKMTILKFDHEQYQVELIKELVAINTTTTNTFAAAKSMDESYNVYNYAIFTYVLPQSKWHEKEAQKKAKNKLKGGKEDINDLM